jgi:cation:H+ antiporter
MDYAYLAAGLLLLFFGGESLVRGAVSLAERMGLSKILVGMVIVGFGTSTPELLVSLQAALADSPEIALGNVIGSNIANVLLILGLAALVFPIVCAQAGLKREAAVMTLVALALLPLLFLGRLTGLMGAGMLVLLAGYLLFSYRLERNSPASSYEAEGEEMTLTPKPLWLSLLIAGAGLAMLLGGARLLVMGATSLARDLGVSEAVIGLTIVAVGTSLPELATSLVAAWRRHSEVALANVVGSNIFNILAILGVTLVVQPIEVAARFAWVDAPIAAGCALLVLLLLWRGGRFSRPVGILFLLAYAAYIGAQSQLG